MNAGRKSPAASTSPPDFFSRQVRAAQRFYLDLAPPTSAPLAVVCGGREHCATDYAIHRATFPYYSIEFVAQGKGRLILAGRSHDLLPGSVFSYGPDVPHDIATDPAAPLVKYFVDFAGSQAEAMLQRYGPAPGETGHVFLPAEVQGIFDHLIENGLRGTRFSPDLCVTFLQALTLKIAESLVPAGAAQTPAFITYQRCRRYIQDHYRRLRSLEEIARRCHVDPAYLCRIFRRYDHQTPYQFLTRLKMNHAAERLQDPGLLVKQVAAELGFQDPFHFSRVFKRVLGLSPDSFRRLR
jgi:AraC-like DNA-binding protein